MLTFFCMYIWVCVCVFCGASLFWFWVNKVPVTVVVMPVLVLVKREQLMSWCPWMTPTTQTLQRAWRMSLTGSYPPPPFLKHTHMNTVLLAMAPLGLWLSFKAAQSVIEFPGMWVFQEGWLTSCGYWISSQKVAFSIPLFFRCLKHMDLYKKATNWERLSHHQIGKDN